ncbi:adult-specific rigid cuticular protein 15.5-like [Varroa destructor]|uniref:Uncharacterized protein n=1 Tax=Varroa destructor TaxID=109461 RepID=A0A7M7MCK5_VARDE|nr:adult-specific rigid cuticular protein 15.5-like [Varroa destructor]
MMKMLSVLFALVATVCAGLTSPAISIDSTVNSRAENGLDNYRFAHDEKHTTDSSFHSEADNPWGVIGPYGLADIDGRQRVVNYVADKLAFRASVKTNESAIAP